MSDEVIRTVVDGGQAEFTIEGSRFIGHITSCTSQSAAEQIIDSVAADHPDATHIVWAYRIADSPIHERATDAGEPSGSAGQPVLGVLQAEELVDVVAVIVRYYGGTNLGYGGLVRSYAQATKAAIDAAEVEERAPVVAIEIDIDYDDSGTVRSILESEDLSYEAAYEEHVRFQLSIPTDRVDSVIDRVLSATGGRAAIDR